MVTIAHPVPSRLSIQPKVLGWSAGVGFLASLLALLTINVTENGLLVQDQSVFDWVTGWDFPGLSSLFGVVTFLTSSKAGLIYGPLSVIISSADRQDP